LQPAVTGAIWIEASTNKPLFKAERPGFVGPPAPQEVHFLQFIKKRLVMGVNPPNFVGPPFIRDYQNEKGPSSLIVTGDGPGKPVFTPWGRAYLDVNSTRQAYYDVPVNQKTGLRAAVRNELSVAAWDNAGLHQPAGGAEEYFFAVTYVILDNKPVYAVYWGFMSTFDEKAQLWSRKTWLTITGEPVASIRNPLLGEFLLPNGKFFRGFSDFEMQNPFVVDNPLK
jgi:hypothetical protein